MELAILWFVAGALTLTYLARVISELPSPTEPAYAACAAGKTVWEGLSKQERKLTLTLLGLALLAFPLFWLLILFINWYGDKKFSFRI